ncbi:MAG: hypothetical protein WKG00_14025 [Polyangiaceae bacterium]
MSLAGVIVLCAVFWGIVALARSWPRSASYRRPPVRSGREPRTHYRSPPDPTEASAQADGHTHHRGRYEYVDRTLGPEALRARRRRSRLRDLPRA